MSKNFVWLKFSLWILIGILALGFVLVGLTHWNPHSTHKGSTPTTGQGHSPSGGKQGGTTNNGGKGGSTGQGNSGNPTNKLPKIAWGIDTTSKVNSSLHRCVINNYGHPAFIGRYMSTEQGVYSGLSKSEVDYLHKQGIKIIPIYDKFNNATGAGHGSRIAQDAINTAKQLGMPKGTFIFADIEKNKPVDSEFLIGWTKTLDKAGYKAGVYGDFDNGQVTGAYKQASKQSSLIKSHLVIWTNQPITGSNKKSHAPNHFMGKSPNLSQTVLWQYSINGSKCNIDTDLIKGIGLKNLW